MAQQQLIVQDFSGGIARLSEKKDIPNSARFVANLDVSLDPSSLTPFPRATKDSGSTVTGLVKWMADAAPWTTDKYFYDASGNIYLRSSGGAWSLDRAGSAMVYTRQGTSFDHGPAGQGLAIYNNYLYYASSYALGRKGPLTVSNAYVDDFKADGTSDLDQQSALSGQTYTAPVAISEAAADLCSIKPTVSPIWVIRLKVTTKGTGSLTLTVHDAANNALGSRTYANANFSGAGAEVQFEIDPAIPIVIGLTYHMHVTSSVADTVIQVGTLNDFSTAYFKEYFSTLEPDADWHPLITANNMLIIGNHRWIGTFDGVVYSPNKILLPPDYHVRALGRDNEYIVAAAWRGTAIDGYEEGALFYWDGIAPTYNFFKPTPMGMPNALVSSKNRLMGVYGSSGDLYIGSDPYFLIQRHPKLARGKKVEIAPGAVSNWQGLTVMGSAYATDDASLVQGVYAWGSHSSTQGSFSPGAATGLPEVMTYAHVISTGTQTGTTTKIGMVAGYGKDLFIGWQDGATYGVDKISKGDNPATSGSWESLIFDNGNALKQKLANKLTLVCTPLVSGTTYTLKYKIDRAANWTSATAYATVGGTSAHFLINQRFHEIEIGFDFANTTDTFKVTSIALSLNDLAGEFDES